MKTYKLLVIFLNILFVTGSFTSCKKTSFEDTPLSVNLYQMITDDTQFSMFRYAVNRAGLQDLLTGGKEITIIVPTNAAFSEMGFGATTGAVLEKLTNEELTQIVKNHIIENKLDLTTLTGSNQVPTMNKTVTITRKDNDYYVDGGDITHMQVTATNGFLYVLNRVILPVENRILKANVYETLKLSSVSSNFTFLLAAINRASLGSTNFINLLSGTAPYTLFAPTNAAFQKDPRYLTLAAVNAETIPNLEALLKRHIIAGTKLTSDFDSVPVNTIAGIPAYFDRNKVLLGQYVFTQNFANGIFFSGRGSGSNNVHQNGSVFHVTSGLLPQPVTTTTLQQIKADPTLTFFDAAIDEASKKTGTTVNFIDLLSDPKKSYTVYAPNNAAFIAAGYSNIAAVRAASIGTLTKLLQYHMLKRRWASGSLADNTGYSTLLFLPDANKVPVSQTITVVVTGGYTVKGTSDQVNIKVLTSDIVTTNGILNIIDGVLTP